MVTNLTHSSVNDAGVDFPNSFRSQENTEERSTKEEGMNIIQKTPIPMGWAPSASRRDPSPSTNEQIRSGKGSRRGEVGNGNGMDEAVSEMEERKKQRRERQLFFLSSLTETKKEKTKVRDKGRLTVMEADILRSLVAVRVMTRDQIQTLWYSENCTRAVVWRLTKMHRKGFIDWLPAPFGTQRVWTFTRRGLQSLEEYLAWQGTDLPVAPPVPRRLKETTVKHQLMIAECYLRLVARGTLYARREAVRSTVWCDGWCRKLEFRKDGKMEYLYPDVWLGAKSEDYVVAFLEVDRGTESGPRIRAAMEKYAGFYGGIHRPRSKLVYVCATETRKEFLQEIYETLSPFKRKVLSNLIVVTIHEIGFLSWALLEDAERAKKNSAETGSASAQ